MNANHVKFSREANGEFFVTLKKRVDDYFKTNNISRFGDHRMIIKSVAMLTMYFGPFVLMLTGVVTIPWVFIGMWAIMGIGIAGIGMSVMHDANHGSYSKNSTVNWLMGQTMNFLGANATVWKIQHNVLHHTYTNIEGADEDINTPVVLRFSPHQKRYWIHKYQHFYFWILYSLSTLMWTTTKDFVQILRYRREGLLNDRGKFASIMARLIGWKIFYYLFILGLPLLLIDSVSPGLIIGGYITMHLITGLLISLVFQAAHVMPTAEFPLPNEQGVVEENWAVHQLRTTANFSPTSRIFSWFIGGLNYQIEHHLFTNICHVHYPKLSKIVQETAKEFGIKYYSQRNFMVVMWEHIKLLKKLGHGEPVAVHAH